MKSTDRVSKAIYLDTHAFDFKIGDLHIEDLEKVDKLFNEYIEQLSREK